MAGASEEDFDLLAGSSEGDVDSLVGASEDGFDSSAGALEDDSDSFPVPNQTPATVMAKHPTTTIELSLVLG